MTEDELRTWQGRILLAKEYQTQYGNQPIGTTGQGRWDTFVHALAGDFNSKADLGDEAIDVNITHSTRKTVLAPLWLQDPYVTFRPTRERTTFEGADVDNIRRAEYAETEVNYWLRELKIRERVTRPCVLDASAANHGYAYLGVIRKKSELETSDGERTEPIPEIQKGRPFVRRISPKHVLLPPGHTYLEESPWVDIIWLKRLDDVIDTYGAERTEGLEATHKIFDNRPTNPDNLSEYLEGEDARLVEIHQIWDKRSKQLLTFADGHDQCLEEEAWDAETEGFPLVDLSFEDIPDDYYGTPEIQYSYPQQKELNALRTNMRSRFNRTKGITWASGSISEEVKSAYANAKDGEVVSTGMTDDVDIRRNLLKDEGLPPDANVHIYQRQIMQDILDVDGVSAEQRGAGDPNIESATASANVEKHAQIRSSDRGDRVRTFYLDIARKIHMLLLQFPNEKRDRLVAGSLAGQFTRLKYTLAEIRGEYALEMDLSTTLAENPQTRETRAVMNYNLFRADPLCNPERLLVDVFKSQNKPDPAGYLLFLRAPDEEFQLVMTGLPAEAHERDNHEVHLKAHNAQMLQISKALEQTTPGDGITMKLQLALGLMLAHANHHMMLLQQIVNEQGGSRQAGSPIAENLFRNQTRQVSGSETSAELRGQPLNEA